MKERNNSIPDVNQRDWVSIITFDTVAGTVLRQGLTGNYDTGVGATMQAVADDQNSTATETGLLSARNYLRLPAQGGSGRANAQKVVVLLTDGVPNLKSSSDSAIGNYRSNDSSSDFYGGSNYVADAALMQSMAMHQSNWRVFSVGLGLGCNFDFMDRLARMGNTADPDGFSPRTSGNPVNYEAELSTIFEEIIDNPQVRLVQ